jgi:hypothetical protein
VPIDSRAKRASSLSMVIGFFTGSLPAPDGTSDQGDRRHALWMYSGIPSGEVTPPSETPVVDLRGAAILVIDLSASF